MKLASGTSPSCASLVTHWSPPQLPWSASLSLGSDSLFSSCLPSSCTTVRCLDLFLQCSVPVKPCVHSRRGVFLETCFPPQCCCMSLFLVPFPPGLLQLLPDDRASKSVLAGCMLSAKEPKLVKRQTRSALVPNKWPWPWHSLNSLPTPRFRSWV